MTVECSSPLLVKLDGPQEYMWKFDVRIQVNVTAIWCNIGKGAGQKIDIHVKY